ncbi:MAG TPA: type IV secretion system protein [Dyella sp.]|uniref:virB8 family protein n=1 Tax=Dyella sp. TaxID=1869338 RepID=UPI002C6D62DE|nr:type IV secretion system protein [Dyella sp.]HUB90284.1 type IV secretion system protein [Dyella sp.]
MPSRKQDSANIDKSVAAAVNFEVTLADIAKRSERRAWLVAMIATVVALILLGGYFYLLPLKEKVPYVVMADAYTGTSSVARLTGDFAHRQITTSEAINRSNVAHFVLARESYDWGTISLRDWPTVLTMAAPNVAAAYRSWLSSTATDGPIAVYGKNQSIRIKILSIVLNGGGPGQTPKSATVRFQRQLFNNNSGAIQPLDSKIATLTFTYKPDLQMNEQYRVENPLGFQVTDYRVDDDYDTRPPAATPGEVQPTTQPIPVADSAAPIPADSAPAAAASAPGTATQPPAISPVANRALQGVGAR